MSGKGFLERHDRIFAAVVLGAVILIWIGVISIEIQPHASLNPQTGLIVEESLGAANSNEDIGPCPLEYGRSDCIDQALITPFYNPGSTDIIRVTMSFQEGDDVDQYNVNQPLSPGETGTLATISCTSASDMGDVELEWCCESYCQTIRMDSPSDDITLA
jgi:hypothetical protein